MFFKILEMLAVPIMLLNFGSGTRDGRPVRTGPEAMPGPEDSFVARNNFV